MGRLIKVSFAGIDEKTRRAELWEFVSDYPVVEFGFLCSRNWKENGNRYPDPKILSNFDCLPLCAHLCGQYAKDAALKDKWDDFNKDYGRIWDRIQLNVAPYIQDEQWTFIAEPSFRMRDIIIQQKSFEQTGLIKTTYNCAILIDASGGTGLDVSFADMKIPCIFPWTKIGFAGGITPDNVVEKVRQIQQISGLGDFWIDMESGVRTDDWFDTKKVRKVLENLRKADLI